jgi:integrase
MESTLRLYRRHTSKCSQGHTKPIFDGDKSVKDCSCPLCVEGYLKHETDSKGKQKRIRHFPVQTTDWNEARIRRDEYITRGSLSASAEDDITALQPDKVTVEDAVKFFFKCGAADGEKGRNTTIKYTQLLNKRFLPWCGQQRNPIRLVKRFDDMVTVREFYNSWRKRKNVDNNQCLETSDGLGSNTKRAMLERFRSFLTFCKDNGWLENNYAKKLKVATADVSQKYAWTMDEYENIVTMLEQWHDERGRTGEYESVRQMAYCLTLRYTGQRISDVSMLGPDNLVEDSEGNWFISLTQVKTGSFVKIPIPAKLAQRLQALPLRGELEQPFILKLARRTIPYGTKFWFWTGESSIYNNCKEWGEHVALVLQVTQQKYGKFKHKSSAHTFRHFFAITMLNAGVNIERVAKWLGHSSPLITAKHYSHANADWHEGSHKDYMAAMERIEGRKTAGKVVRMKRVG